jgi:hypothetical protein
MISPTTHTNSLDGFASHIVGQPKSIDGVILKGQNQIRSREAAGVIFPSHICWHVADPSSRSGFKTRIRKIARLREYVWHPSPEPLLTLSSQAFPTELKRNPSIYLPTMNSTRIRLKHRKGSMMNTRRDTTAAWASAFVARGICFSKTAVSKWTPRHLSYRAVGLGWVAESRTCLCDGLPVFITLWVLLQVGAAVLSLRSLCPSCHIVSCATMFELSFRQFLPSRHGLSILSEPLSH